MTEPPRGVRIAEPADLDRLWDLCLVGHATNGAFRIAPHKIIAVLKRACWRNPDAVIGLIDGPERIEAAVCLMLGSHWYSEDLYWSDRFLYVHPAHRRSRHAFRLFRFVEWWANVVGAPCGAPVVMSIETFDRLGAKEALFGRYARRVGASYLFGKVPMEDEAACARVAAALIQ